MIFFTTIAALLCALYSSPHVDNAAIFSIGASNLSYAMIDSDESVFSADISSGFSRTDAKGRVSGFGVAYSMHTDKNILNGNYVRNKNLFGLRVFSFIDFPIRNFSIGFRSLFDLGFLDHNFVVGPTAGYSFYMGAIKLNINYFKGCSDFVKFSRYTDSIEARIALPLKGKDN